jgi:hypothetical protein
MKRPARRVSLARLALLAVCILVAPFGGSSALASDNPVLTDLIDAAHARHLADDRYWHLLLHYRRATLGGSKSEADGPGFFLAKNGKHDPRAELDATLAAFFDPVPADPEVQHPQCRFPARYAWLKDQLGFDASRLPERPCERFATWRSRLDAESVTMLFAAAYLDNPASMYGHTFLRLNRSGHREGERLLDYTVNFAAVTDTRSGIVFAIRGLTGSYEGRFSTAPFYVKVQEYNNFQSRDLWEYTLTLSREQIDRLVRHLWEMGTTYFDYYFLSENCSYQLLPLLDVADPSLHLADHASHWVVPVDTIRILRSRPGLVSTVRYRPSHVSQMLDRRARLVPDEVAAATAVAERADDAAFARVEGFPEARRAPILDSAHDYFRYREGFYLDQPDEVRLRERRILLSRSRLGGSSISSDPPLPDASPEAGHFTGRVGLGVGFTKDSRFEELSIRLALHDLAEEDTGYIPDSHLEMGHLRLRYDHDRNKLFVDRLAIIDIVSLSPWDRWIRRASWKVGLGLDLATELDCVAEECLYAGLNTGRGIAVSTAIWRRETWYALAEADLGVGGVFHDRYRLGGGATAGLLFQASSWWRVHFEGTHTRYPLGENQPRTLIRLNQVVTVFGTHDLRLTLERNGRYHEAVLGLYAHF